MSDLAIEVDSVWKKFHRGEFHDSLRDFVPALTRRLMGRGPKREELAEGDFWALKDVSFQVRRGEVLGIIGANGAGKSTLLKILAKILKPNRGQIRVNGRLRALIEVAAGFHPDLTGRENIYLNGSILGMKKREIDAKFDEIVEFSGVSEFLDTPVKRYSSGMHARLGFAVAAHLEPEILLVDEVLSVGDARFQKRCYKRIEELISRGVAIIFISHNLDAVSRLCTKTMLLIRGENHYCGTTGHALCEYATSSVRSKQTNGAVTLEMASICDASGVPCAVFSPGTECRINVVLKSQKSYRALSCGLSVVSGTGQEVSHINTCRLANVTSFVAEGDAVRVAGSLVLNLASGGYTIQVHGYDYDGISEQVFRFDLGDIRVAASSAHGGIVYLAPRLEQIVEPSKTTRTSG